MSMSDASALRRGPLLRKSRAGCRECRIRKVKCDEVRPTCSNCRRRYVSIETCEWNPNNSPNHGHLEACSPLTLLDELGSKPASRSRTNENITSLSPYSRIVTSNGQWRNVELRLMYHYTAVVRHTMPACKGAGVNAWQETIPQLSFESDIVLNSMLTLSALHLHAHSTQDTTMAIVLRRYLGRALLNHREALLATDESFSEPLWLSSVLLSHIYWLLVHQVQPDEPFRLPLQAFQMLDGAGVVFEERKVTLGQHGYDWLGNETMSHITWKAKLSLSAESQLKQVEEDIACLFEAFNVAAMSQARRSIYLEAKHYILHHYQAFFSGADDVTLQRFIAFMVIRLQAGYRKMLEQHDPLAMALLARMLVLLKALDHVWWANGEGNYEVVERNVRGICEIIPKNVRWIMDWPCRILDKDVLISRDL